MHKNVDGFPMEGKVMHLQIGQQNLRKDTLRKVIRQHEKDTEY